MTSNNRLFCLFAACALGLGCSGDDQGPESYVVQVSPATLSLGLVGAGASGTITATVTRKSIVDNTVPVAWTTSDAAIASVSGAGQVATITGMGHGTAKITANVQGASAAVDVNVVAPDCVFSAATPVLTPGVRVNAALSIADCRYGNAPAKGYQITFPPGPSGVNVVMSSTAFGPKLAIFSAGSTTPIRTDNGTANSACIWETSVNGNRTLFIIATSRTTDGKGSFTLDPVTSGSPCGG